MLLHGDELGRTQQGNNNTYCQDSELSWIHWDAMDQPLVEFTAVVTKLRHDHPTFRRSRFFDGRPVRRGEGEQLPDIVWLKPDGTECCPRTGTAASAGRSACSSTATASRSRTPAAAGSPTTASCSTSTPTTTTWTSACRPRSTRRSGTSLIDTADQADTEEPLKAGSVLKLAAKSMVVLRAHSGPEVEVDYSAAASLAAMAEHERAPQPTEHGPEAAAATPRPAAKAVDRRLTEDRSA